MKIIIATIKHWNIEKAKQLQKQMQGKHEIILMTTKEELTCSRVNEINPELILFPHWSYFIPEEIFEKFTCVVFHMTDLPYGRGGSPLQNLIVRGKKDTVISAIKVTKILDAGPVYMKEPLSLEGSAEEIFERCSETIFKKMIPAFLTKIPEPKEQVGEVTVFKRRKPEDSRILQDMDIEKVYDYIRMLDGEGYPKAFLEYGPFRLEFDKASILDGKLEARVIFTRSEVE